MQWELQWEWKVWAKVTWVKLWVVLCKKECLEQWAELWQALWQVVLEVQVAQLNAEASRAQEAHANLSRAIGPVLEGVEQRLARIRHEQFLRQQQQLAQ